MISSFQGEYRFLSNFWEEPVVLKGRKFKTAEHAYQACKTLEPGAQQAIMDALTPGEAKRRGANVSIRPDWETIKVAVMTAVIQAKFASTTKLSHKLMLTGSHELVEGNAWGDKFWGCVLEPAGGTTWVGRNELGLILMAQRTVLQHEIPYE